MNRFFRLLTALLVITFWAGSAYAVSPVEVLSLDSKITISREDKITVLERLIVNVPTDGTNRGMIRDIPVASRWKDKGRLETKLKVLAVEIDGKPHPTDDIEEQEGFVSVYMRDKNAYLSKGRHVFALKYEITNVVGFFEEQDELTWNAVGPGWNGIQESFCVVQPPEGTDFTQYKAWLGQRRSKDSPVIIKETDIDGQKAVIFKAARPIEADEIFTIAVAWPKGTSIAPAPVRPENQDWLTEALATLLVIVLGTAFLLWYKYGRDPKFGPVIPLFYPPEVPDRLTENGTKKERLSAVAVNWLMNDHTVDGRGLAALFLTFGLNKFCSLKGNTKEGFRILKLKDVEGLSPEENEAGRYLPEELPLKKDITSAGSLYSVRIACQRKLDEQYGASLFRMNGIGSILLSFVPAMAGLYAITEYDFGSVWPDDVVDLYCQLGFTLICTVMLCAAAWKLLRDWNRSFRKILGLLVGAACYVFMIYLLYSDFSIDELGWLYSPLQLALIVLIHLVPVCFAPFMDAPSAEEARLKHEVAGLAMYIGTAESKLLNIVNPPEKTLALYHRLLPYALVLGLEKAWGARFAKVIQAADTGETGAPVFDDNKRRWYDTRWLDDMVAETCSVDSYVTSQYARSYSDYDSSDSGSSFSYGGGGAGSGGGGGGGRAC